MNPYDLVYLHPAWQVFFTLLGLYVAWLGLQRTRSLHWGQKAAFARRRHILLGKTVLVGLILGAVGGAILARWMWLGWLITGPHAWLGMAVVVLALLGLGLGLYLERHAGGGAKGLALAHGIVNLLVITLCLVQFYVGDEILDALVD